MPSPFPGMDPYLEGASWGDVHTQLSAEIARQLTPRLRPRYLARTTRRFVMEIQSGVAVTLAGVYPDVGVLRERVSPAYGASAQTKTRPLRMATVLPEPVPLITVEIRDVAERRLVTAIEVLSPTNKRGEGRQEYLGKRQRLLLSDVHLIEIDLLRAGERLPMRSPLPSVPYFVFLSRAGQRPFTDVWPISLDEPLPTIPVPLLPGDADVELDLQSAFTSVYDALGYDLEIDYARPPEVPLEPEWAPAADAILVAAGRRA